MTEHKYADIFCALADGVPASEFEYFTYGPKWFSFERESDLLRAINLGMNEIRRKTRTINIKGFEVPESSATITNAAPSCHEPLKTKDITSEVIKHFDEAVECARLIGHTQAMKIHGAFTKNDSRFVVAMYQSIEKHENAVKEILDKRFEE